MARIINGHGQIDFGIDGLADTLHLYRKNVKYNSVIANAQAFINAGGRAQWNFIVFKHNEYQIDLVKQYGKAMGFHNVLIRKTGRFLNHATMTEMDSWPVANADHVLEPPRQEQYRNRSMQYLPELKKQYINIKEYFDTTPIQCDALKGNKVAINAEGTVLPCNFFNHNLYDARFSDGTLPGANPLSTVDGKNQVREFLERYGLDNLNIHHKTLPEIFANDFWQDLVASFNNSNRLFECAMTCGKKFTKVWDQSK
jgi:MoaA/NifB/PqqE/SkfB family radical SAM enzyme